METEEDKSALTAEDGDPDVDLSKDSKQGECLRDLRCIAQTPEHVLGGIHLDLTRSSRVFTNKTRGGVIE